MADIYVSSLAAGGGSGASGSPFTLAEAVAYINGGSLAIFETCWIKADGEYSTSGIDITLDGAYNQWRYITGYSATIGDGGIATIKCTGGAATNIFYLSGDYWILSNITVDGNSNTYGGSGACLRGNSYTFAVNCKALNGGKYGFWAWNGLLSCSSIGNTLYGYESNMHYRNCYSYGNGGYGYRYSGTAINCVAKNEAYGFGAMQVVSGCVVDSCITAGINVDRAQMYYDCVLINNPIGLYFSRELDTPINLIEGIVFYGNTSNSNNIAAVSSYTIIDPGYNNSGSLDYTRINANLNNTGYNKVGQAGDMANIDYKIASGFGTYVPSSPTYADAADVRDGVDRGDGTDGTLDLPLEADVEAGVTFDGATKTGTFVVPAVTDVTDGVFYGDSNEFEGTQVIPDTTPPTFAGITQLEAVGGGCLRLVWSAATGTFNAYNIYIKDTNATDLFTDTYLLASLADDITEFFLRTEADGSTFLQNTKTYYVGVRALNFATEDDNTVSLSAVITGDGSTYVKTPKIGLNI